MTRQDGSVTTTWQPTKVTWALRMALSDAETLAGLRLLDLRVLVENDQLWVTGPQFDEALQRALLTLPGGDRYTVLPDRQLVPEGCLVPTGVLPSGVWLTIREFLPVGWETRLWPGHINRRASWQLVRTSHYSEPNVLLVDRAAWCEYGVAAPQVRLDRWHFAMNAASDALVRGAPLPPLPGMQFVESEGVAVPAGWERSPPLAPAIVREVLSLSAGDFVLQHVDGTCDVVPAGDFVAASRSAIRASSVLTSADGQREGPHV